ncbi:MAG: tRNA pseudouridine(13) synthase TruD [Candidatus Thorarchaeota archaeon]|nr:tRNA pseudouridine(13) synthase TruD [Candidatus Thorarchaeota archaeon]
MIEPNPLEVLVGMELYSTEAKGVGGRLKARFEDFRVEEILQDGRNLELQKWPDESDPAATVELTIGGDKRKYVRFIVQKLGLSTMDVSTILATELGLPRHLVSYAGLKDKRALTVQSMSVPAGASQSLAKLKLFKMSIRDMEYVRQPVQIGDLWGNRFAILLRELESSCTDSMGIAQELAGQFILNYFGVQRFGVTRPDTHMVGKAAVKGDFEGALRIMLTITSEYESEELTGARQDIAQNMTVTQKILDCFPRGLRHERIVLRHLMKYPGDYHRAFTKIPSRIQTFFVHSYQSYLFNRLISQRLRSGLSIQSPLPGDFLMQLDEAHSGRDSWLFVTERNLEQRRELVSSAAYGVAAPLPGFSTRMPPSLQSEMLDTILKDEGITLMDFRSAESKALASPGSLHLVSIKVPELNPRCDDDGLWLQFKLRKGSYATVVMREIMKNHPINRI